MRAAARALRWLGGALGLLIAALAAVFGLAQTPADQAWLATTRNNNLGYPQTDVWFPPLMSP